MFESKTTGEYKSGFDIRFMSERQGGSECQIRSTGGGRSITTGLLAIRRLGVFPIPDRLAQRHPESNKTLPFWRL
jgi:hypothetical protein